MLNKLIVLEGTDGAGKSTQTQKVKDYLTANELKYEYFHFPMYGHNEFSEIIAAFLRGEYGKVDDVDPYFVANIYGMDRFMFLPELERALKENDVVLLDRYVFSNLAYQGAKFEVDESEKIKTWIHKLEFGFLKLPYPDLSIFFDVPMDVVKERLAIKREGDDRKYLKGKSDIHEEDLDFQSRVRDNYLGLVGATNYKIVSCTWTNRGGKRMVYKPDELFDNYKQYLDYVLTKPSV